PPSHSRLLADGPRGSRAPPPAPPRGLSAMATAAACRHRARRGGAAAAAPWPAAGTEARRRGYAAGPGARSRRPLLVLALLGLCRAAAAEDAAAAGEAEGSFRLGARADEHGGCRADPDEEPEESEGDREEGRPLRQRQVAAGRAEGQVVGPGARSRGARAHRRRGGGRARRPAAQTLHEGRAAGADTHGRHGAIPREEVLRHAAAAVGRCRQEEKKEEGRPKVKV
ncbi:unnamed protein product, partial [Prorocentrum cordatum]